VSKPVRIERAAEEELRDSIIWYEQRRDGLGAEFYREVQRVLKMIEHNPRLGSPVPNVASHRNTRRVLLRRFPFTVVYRELDAEIQVIAFAHTSRKPGYWRKR
jgi:toxin ParE1/3/4